MEREKDFGILLQGKKFPVCTLDEKWHKLFELKGKPDDIEGQEQKLNGLLKQQGQLNSDMKDMKKLKSKLMANIMDNMDGTHEENADRISAKKLEADKRLIDEINEKIDACADRLKELPNEIDRANQELMALTAEYCYEKLRTNVEELQQINAWIAQVRIDLKKNIIRKQNREINSRQIYAYMHDIFGADMMDVFDLDDEEIDLGILNSNKTKSQG